MMRSTRGRIAVCLISFSLFVPHLVHGNASPARFAEHTISADLRGDYQVVATDINHDGKPDLIALASGMDELVWFENPGWRRRVLVGNISRAINCAAWDTDGDGIPLVYYRPGSWKREVISEELEGVLHGVA